MEMCSNFKVCEYLSKPKVRRSAELHGDSVVYNRSHHSGKSYHSRRSSSSSTSSKSKLIEAKTRLAAFEVKAAFPEGKASAKNGRGTGAEEEFS